MSDPHLREHPSPAGSSSSNPSPSAGRRVYPSSFTTGERKQIQFASHTRFTASRGNTHGAATSRGDADVGGPPPLLVVEPQPGSGAAVDNHQTTTTHLRSADGSSAATAGGRGARLGVAASSFGGGLRGRSLSANDVSAFQSADAATAELLTAHKPQDARLQPTDSGLFLSATAGSFSGMHSASFFTGQQAPNEAAADTALPPFVSFFAATPQPLPTLLFESFENVSMGSSNPPPVVYMADLLQRVSLAEQRAMEGALDLVRPARRLPLLLMARAAAQSPSYKHTGDGLGGSGGSSSGEERLFITDANREQLAQWTAVVAAQEAATVDGGTDALFPSAGLVGTADALTEAEVLQVMLHVVGEDAGLVVHHADHPSSPTAGLAGGKGGYCGGASASSEAVALTSLPRQRLVRRLLSETWGSILLEQAVQQQRLALRGLRRRLNAYDRRLRRLGKGEGGSASLQKNMSPAKAARCISPPDAAEATKAKRRACLEAIRGLRVALAESATRVRAYYLQDVVQVYLWYKECASVRMLDPHHARPAGEGANGSRSRAGAAESLRRSRRAVAGEVQRVRRRRTLASEGSQVAPQTQPQIGGTAQPDPAAERVSAPDVSARDSDSMSTSSLSTDRSFGADADSDDGGRSNTSISTTGSGEDAEEASSPILPSLEGTNVFRKGAGNIVVPLEATGSGGNIGSDGVMSAGRRSLSTDVARSEGTTVSPSGQKTQRKRKERRRRRSSTGRSAGPPQPCCADADDAVGGGPPLSAPCARIKAPRRLAFQRVFLTGFDEDIAERVRRSKCARCVAAFASARRARLRAKLLPCCHKKGTGGGGAPGADDGHQGGPLWISPSFIFKNYRAMRKHALRVHRQRQHPLTSDQTEGGAEGGDHRDGKTHWRDHQDRCGLDSTSSSSSSGYESMSGSGDASATNRSTDGNPQNTAAALQQRILDEANANGEESDPTGVSAAGGSLSERKSFADHHDDYVSAVRRRHAKRTSGTEKAAAEDTGDEMRELSQPPQIVVGGAGGPEEAAAGAGWKSRRTPRKPAQHGRRFADHSGNLARLPPPTTSTQHQHRDSAGMDDADEDNSDADGDGRKGRYSSLGAPLWALHRRVWLADNPIRLSWSVLITAVAIVTLTLVMYRNTVLSFRRACTFTPVPSVLSPVDGAPFSAHLSYHHSDPLLIQRVLWDLLTESSDAKQDIVSAFNASRCASRDTNDVACFDTKPFDGSAVGGQQPDFLQFLAQNSSAFLQSRSPNLFPFPTDTMAQASLLKINGSGSARVAFLRQHADYHYLAVHATGQPEARYCQGFSLFDLFLTIINALDIYFWTRTAAYYWVSSALLARFGHLQDLLVPSSTGPPGPPVGSTCDGHAGGASRSSSGSIGARLGETLTSVIPSLWDRLRGRTPPLREQRSLMPFFSLSPPSAAAGAALGGRGASGERKKVFVFEPRLIRAVYFRSLWFWLVDLPAALPLDLIFAFIAPLFATVTLQATTEAHFTFNVTGFSPGAGFNASFVPPDAAAYSHLAPLHSGVVGPAGTAAATSSLAAIIATTQLLNWTLSLVFTSNTVDNRHALIDAFGGTNLAVMNSPSTRTAKLPVPLVVTTSTSTTNTTTGGGFEPGDAGTMASDSATSNKANAYMAFSVLAGFFSQLRCLKVLRVFASWSVTGYTRFSPRLLHFFHNFVPLYKLFIIIVAILIVLTMTVAALKTHNDSARDLGAFPFSTALYLIIQSVTTVGYGDINMESEEEHWFLIFLFSLAMVSNGIVVSMLVAIVQRPTVRSVREDQLRQLLAVLRFFQIPKPLQVEILNFQSHVLHSDILNTFPQTVNMLPGPLNDNIDAVRRMKAFLAVPELAALCRGNDAVIVELARLLLLRTYKPEEYVCFAATPHGGIRIVAFGFLDILRPDGTYYCTIKSGAYFGLDESLPFAGFSAQCLQQSVTGGGSGGARSPRFGGAQAFFKETFSCKAISYSDVYVLPLPSLIGLCTRFPRFGDRFALSTSATLRRRAVRACAEVALMRGPATNTGATGAASGARGSVGSGTNTTATTAGSGSVGVGGSAPMAVSDSLILVRQHQRLQAAVHDPSQPSPARNPSHTNSDHFADTRIIRNILVTSSSAMLLGGSFLTAGSPSFCGSNAPHPPVALPFGQHPSLASPRGALGGSAHFYQIPPPTRTLTTTTSNSSATNSGGGILSATTSGTFPAPAAAQSPPLVGPGPSNGPAACLPVPAASVLPVYSPLLSAFGVAAPVNVSSRSPPLTANTAAAPGLLTPSMAPPTQAPPQPSTAPTASAGMLRAGVSRTLITAGQPQPFVGGALGGPATPSLSTSAPSGSSSSSILSGPVVGHGQAAATSPPVTLFGSMAAASASGPSPPPPPGCLLHQSIAPATATATIIGNQIFMNPRAAAQAQQHAQASGGAAPPAGRFEEVRALQQRLREFRQHLTQSVATAEEAAARQRQAQILGPTTVSGSGSVALQGGLAPSHSELPPTEHA